MLQGHPQTCTSCRLVFLQGIQATHFRQYQVCTNLYFSDGKYLTPKLWCRTLPVAMSSWKSPLLNTEPSNAILVTPSPAVLLFQIMIHMPRKSAKICRSPSLVIVMLRLVEVERQREPTRKLASPQQVRDGSLTAAGSNLKMD